MNKNVEHITNCYGCGVCASVCAQKAISIQLDEDGFYAPRITNPKACTFCGLCLNVCAYNHEQLSNEGAYPLKSWAAWSLDTTIRKACSSGGIGFELGKQCIEKGYKAIGCLYNVKEQRAEHYIATTIDELKASIGSKYIQSYTVDAFQQIKNSNEKYIIFGTPCQIDSLRRMIRLLKMEDRFILVDFFCHCVPSMFAWKAYLKTLDAKLGRILNVSWRSKERAGWQDSWEMEIQGERDTYKSPLSKGDIFYKLFLGDIALGPQCDNKCKYKYNKSSADIRIGDFWGNTYKDDQKGVSAVVAFTTLGQRVIEQLQQVSLIEHPFEQVAEGQMKTNAHAKELKPFFMKKLKEGYSVDGLWFKIAWLLQKTITITKHQIHKLCR